MKSKNIIWYILIILLFILCGCKEEVEEPVEIEEKEYGNLYIHYVLNNGENDVVEKVSDIENYKFINVSKEGHNFINWYSDPDLKDRFLISDLEMPSDERDSTFMAYAKWEKTKYIVKFMCNDKQVFSQAVEYGEAAKEPNATVIPGFVFVGWDHEFNEVKENLTINAIYEVKQEESKNVLVVLGNWMNNDGTISSTMRKRLELALVANSEFKPSYIVVTGGMANAQAGISEAQAMYNYLVDKGVDPNIIIKEDKSMSTYQNANYTMTKLENIDFKNLIIVSTIEHFVNYQTIKYFNDAALNNSKIKAKGIAIMIYTNNGSY